eukprot:338088-Chlamydomonas_euryale.AAC.1
MRHTHCAYSVPTCAIHPPSYQTDERATPTVHTPCQRARQMAPRRHIVHSPLGRSDAARGPMHRGACALRCGNREGESGGIRWDGGKQLGKGIMRWFGDCRQELKELEESNGAMALACAALIVWSHFGLSGLLVWSRPHLQEHSKAGQRAGWQAGWLAGWLA